MTYSELEEEWRSDSDVMICHTSGSTGAPSRIKLPKSMMRESAFRTCEFFGLSSDSLLYSAIGPDYIGGKMMWIRAHCMDASFLFESPSNRPLSSYEGRRIDLLSVVPSQMVFLLDNPDRLKLVKNFLIGGSSIPPEIRKRIIQSGIEAYESYGMTETASHIALRKIAPVYDNFCTLPGISVFDASDRRLGIRFDNGMEFITNDVAEIISDTEFRILGRIDNVIISGGCKIHPEVLEYRLKTYLPFEFYLKSRRHDKWGQILVMVAENPTLSHSEIKEICRKNCLQYEMPKEIETVDRLPRTPNGKIKRI